MSVDFSTQVAQSFIKQYYEVFVNNPSQLDKFYLDDSYFSYGVGLAEHTVPAGGPEAIRNLVKDLNFTNCNIDLEDGSVDAQKSGSDGVIIVVTGMITLKGEVPRFFIQTFFLASQRNHQFYVRNTIMRLMTPPTAPATVPPSAPEVATNGTIIVNSMEKPAEIKLETAEETEVVAAPAPAEPIAEVEEPVAEVAETEVEEDKNEEPSEIAESIEQGPPTVRSYAAMLKSGVTVGQASTPTATATKPVAGTAVKRVAAPATSNGSTGNGKATVSVYVKQFPEDTTAAELKAKFAEFGEVANVDLSAKGFAFLDFNSAAALQAVLTSSEPITIRGSTLKIEARNSGKTGSRGTGSGSAGTNGRKGSGENKNNGGGGGGADKGGRERQKRGSEGDKGGRDRQRR